MKNYLLAAVLVSLISACVQKQDAAYLIKQSIEASGGERYTNSVIDFDFRDHHYQISRSPEEWTMLRIKADSGQQTVDTFSGKSFSRSINDSLVEPPDSMIFKYQESINSVFYFALLPFKLNDAAVIADRLPDEQIDGKMHYKIEIRFKEEGGGEDFQDVFIYWFDQQDYSLDYLAYSFQVNGGGLRFRKAYNERVIGGIRFVDYLNFKAPKEMAVENLAAQFEAGKLEELSRIELENIEVERRREIMK